MPDGEIDHSNWIRALLATFFVIIVAVVFRIPSCHESFWVDELHSAWVVADGFAEVGPRAAIGNQTPYYFQLLWLWQRIFGDGELAMRASSVFLSALAAGVLTLGIAVQTQRIAAGVVAGGIIAVESNAVFFGCELRSYAAVMLCAACAVWAAARMMDQDEQNGRTRFLLILSVSIAALVHPTSVGVLAVLATLSFLVIYFTKKIAFDRWDTASIVMISVVGALLVLSSLPDSWERREQWRAFASASDSRDFWVKSWNWIPLVFIPSGIGIVLGLVALIRKYRERPYGSFVPMAAGAIGTLLFFFASYFDIVPLWHRRYFIAALPLLAWSAGMLCGFALPKSRLGNGIGAVIAIVVLGNLLWCQNSLTVLKRGSVPQQLRYEDWREAIEYVTTSKKAGDSVWVDAALIEGAIFQKEKPSDELDPDQREYLAFPLRGPYRVENARAISVVAHKSWLDHWFANINDGTKTLWVVTRGRSEKSINKFSDSIRHRFQVSGRKKLGSIAVAELQVTAN